MSLNSSSYFSNSIVGNPQTGADVNIYQTDALPKYALGWGFKRADGNVYRYAYVGGAINAGTLVSPTFTSSGKAVTDNIVIAPASAVAVPFEPGILAGSVGSHYVQITLAAVTANQYKGGYLTIEDGSGKFFTYRIKGNTATDNPATGDFRIQLYDAIKIALSPNSDIIITPSMYNDLIANSTATNWAVVGVLVSTTTAALPFAWICTHGVTNALQDNTGATMVGGDIVGESRYVSGSVMVWGGGGTSVNSAVGEQPVGYCIQVGGDAEQAVVFLTLE